MKKKVIVISTSLRSGSNSDMLADQFIEGAMSGQMKTLIDRMNALYPKDYRFRDVYLLSTATENEEYVPKRAESGLTGWTDCYPNSRLAGTLFCGGVTMPHYIDGNSKLQEAYELGKNV